MPLPSPSVVLLRTQSGERRILPEARAEDAVRRQPACGTAALPPGVTVREAEAVLQGGTTVFREIELAPWAFVRHRCPDATALRPGGR